MNRIISIILCFLFFSNILFSQNSTPSTPDLFYSTKINTSITLDLFAVDLNFDDNITYNLLTNPQNGTVSLSGNKVTYTPSTNYTGSDTFTYNANDGTNSSFSTVYSFRTE